MNFLIEGLGKVDSEKALEKKKSIWREKPEVYAKERLNLNLTDEQIQILYSIKNKRRTAVKAHHSLGKTFVAAIALLWWVDCWDAHIGYVTAPTWGQALGLTFKQAKRLAMINKLDIHFDILESGIIRDKDKFKQTGRFIKALNAENGEGFQGEHTAPILIVVEEAVGVPNYIFDASEGLMTHPDCRIIEIANPTDEATAFGEHCESSNYEVFSFSALNHPNIEAELNCLPVPFPGAVSLQWLYEMINNECEPVDTNAEDCFEFYTLEVVQDALNETPINQDSPKTFYKPTAFFQGRVLGEFPTEASNKVIPKGWLNNIPVKQANPDGKLQIGSDVARFGDDRSTGFARCGQVCLFGKVVRKFDNLAVVGMIEDLYKDLAAYILKFNKVVTKKDVVINIDVTGGLGTGPFDILKDKGYNVVAINSSESPKNDEYYLNKRSELWFDVSDRFRAKEIDYSRLDLEVKKTLTKELAIPLYKVNSRGKKVVEDKADIKKRLGASPDLADGFNLAFYEIPVHEYTDQSRQALGLLR